MSKHEIKSLNRDDLPQKAGVLLVGCSEHPQHELATTIYDPLAAVETLNIRKTVEDMEHQWALKCKGYLCYWATLSDDPDERKQILLREIKHHKR